MLRISEIQADKTQNNWSDDLIIGLNAGMALTTENLEDGIRIMGLAPEFFEKILGPTWSVNLTGHSVVLVKEGLRIQFIDVADRGLSLLGAPRQMQQERTSLGLPI